ncbi:MAG TPA: UvrD-helicase domain-containing protein [Gammaproteobacteria bacterium]
MRNEVADQSARARALDVARSFIVQAPAGSGKTELLIRRFLALLLTVRHPEQVVAITFTRKAAAEMRARVLEAMRDAHEPAANSEKGAATRALARRVLGRDAELGWALLEQPQRLRIDTLDAMNAWLARRLPLLAGGVADAKLTESPARLYAEAARRTLQKLGDDDPVAAALRVLLPSADNSVARFEKMLAALLPTRDRWLRSIVAVDADLLRARLDASLETHGVDLLAAAEGLLGRMQIDTLVELARHAALRAEDPRTLDRLRAWRDLAALPSGPAALDAWRGIAHLLLTEDGEWRVRFTRSSGFGPAHPAERAAIEDLCNALRANEPLRAALAALDGLPEASYSNAHWADLTALRAVLLHVVAELRVVFAEQQTIDFVELAIAAEQALGETEDPSELLLALDQRIQHVLVDEFQDTSHAQLRLLERLTAGWTQGDGRTLFLVGDPMQSIYRFRDADMTLFLRAQRHGLGAVALEPLALESNFRSAPPLAAWINGAFTRIFPHRDDPELGTAQFHACIAAREGGEGQGVELHALRADTPTAEIARVAEIVARERALRPAQSIAILVQSRSHLRGLETLLSARGLDAHALEIEAPAETGIGQDLLGLTRALTHLGDRIAWLGVLHAPWCGLAWRDLEALCAGSAEQTVWSLLNDDARLARLTPDGQARARALRAVLRVARAARGRMSLGEWVEHTWRMLDGPSLATSSVAHEQAASFFAALDELSNDGDLDDPPALEELFCEPRRQADPPAGAGIEMMTIHRAKGLEFDTVIVLGLARRVRGPDSAALYWQERFREDGSTSLLVVPLSRTESRLERYLRRVEQERDAAERARLLYVAATRARERLYLVAQLGMTDARPERGTLLALLWPEIAPRFQPPAARTEREATRTSVALPLVRVAGGDDASAVAAVAPAAAAPPRTSVRPPFEWASHAAIQVGTIVHRYLQCIAATGADFWTTARLDGALPRIRAELALLGVAPAILEEAAAHVRTALQSALADARGRWILAPHDEAVSELRLALVENGMLEHIVLDRSFVDTGTRWIIDYKTSRHEGGDMAAFLDAEVARYRPQLERYAQALANVEARPIRLGLYFPLLRSFREWSFARADGATDRG